MTKTAIVTGGTGYIGSNFINFVLEKKFFDKIIILDDCVRGKNETYLLSKWGLKVTLLKYKIEEFNDFYKLLDLNLRFSPIFHFAGLAYVGESYSDPETYYRRNIDSTLKICEIAKYLETKKLIFSSSCAVYGNQDNIISEETDLFPVSPYGWSKLFCENVLKKFSIINNIDIIALRYFNVAGANPKFESGERHNPETHLIPLIVEAATESKIFFLFGDNYNTNDGTCEREYVHITDLVEAHYLAYMMGAIGYRVYNLGTGNPVSNKELINLVSKKLDTIIDIVVKEKRAGDATRLFSSSALAKKELGWIPKRSQIDIIINDYILWYNKYII